MAPAALWSPATTTSSVALKCTNYRCGCAARNRLNVSCLFTVSPPAATPLIATIAPITPSSAAIITWSQTTETA